MAEKVWNFVFLSKNKIPNPNSNTAEKDVPHILMIKASRARTVNIILCIVIADNQEIKKCEKDIFLFPVRSDNQGN